MAHTLYICKSQYDQLAADGQRSGKSPLFRTPGNLPIIAVDFYIRRIKVSSLLFSPIYFVESFCLIGGLPKLLKMASHHLLVFRDVLISLFFCFLLCEKVAILRWSWIWSRQWRPHRVRWVHWSAPPFYIRQTLAKLSTKLKIELIITKNIGFCSRFADTLLHLMFHFFFFPFLVNSVANYACDALFFTMPFIA